MNPTITTSLDYTLSDQLANEIITIMVGYFGEDAREKIQKTIWDTYIFAREAHDQQVRKSGEPYITHPLQAAKLLLRLSPDIVTVQACILHDVIEDTPKNEADIEKLFGKSVAEICQGLSKLSNIKYRGEERSIESLRKMLVAMVSDLRVIIVKLADRLHNMQTLEHHPDPVKRERIALETLNIYAPIADRLGIFEFKEALETECFRILYPEEYIRITTELASLREEQDFFMHKAKEVIRSVISEEVPILDISYRIKAPFSIYRKLSRKEYSYTHTRDLYDLFAVRIITDDVRHCYEILGVLHNIFVPMPKRFKDYIALPKENGYQSLHTTVVGLFPDLRSQPTEIQIRTVEMHRQAEVGVAAHFEYSETGKSQKSKDSYWVQTIKGIIDADQAGGEFMHEMKMNVFEDQIFVFTPRGDIITLPKGSTPIDFAYSVHSNLGNTVAIAKVNGHVVPLDYKLHNGESIEIITDKDRKPKPIWLSFVATAKAKEYIRQFINREERTFFIEKGRTILNGYLTKNYAHGLDKELSILRNIDGHNLDMKEREDILVQLGNLSRKPNSILRVIHDEIIQTELGERKIDDKNITGKKKPSEEKGTGIPNGTYVIIGKARDIPYKLAKCCEPTPENKRIVGAIGQGIITIHRVDCENIKKIELERRMLAKWSDDDQQSGIIFVIECTLMDKRGLLMELTTLLYGMGLGIKSVTTDTISSGQVKDTFTLEYSEDDYYIYDRLEARFRFEIKELIEMKLISMN
ncbi:bifunctional (p)ppGpp synthetase/guanosine-3',5'-bis(diphosphate) 3'-pyrophosphohydrolase [Candidatus Gracilibacteria bacterium]|nr:bifunctional (p)ppGpp synthetase/guanosine-3',5'-bis(diphosphate) 3'-pyrophosphohydrolase [Candidatus Gracilibacteria bacterium]